MSIEKNGSKNDFLFLDLKKTLNMTKDIVDMNHFDDLILVESTILPLSEEKQKELLEFTDNLQSSKDYKNYGRSLSLKIMEICPDVGFAPFMDVKEMKKIMEIYKVKKINLNLYLLQYKNFLTNTEYLFEGKKMSDFKTYKMKKLKQRYDIIKNMYNDQKDRADFLLGHMERDLEFYDIVNQLDLNKENKKKRDQLLENYVSRLFDSEYQDEISKKEYIAQYDLISKTGKRITSRMTNPNIKKQQNLTRSLYKSLTKNEKNEFLQNITNRSDFNEGYVRIGIFLLLPAELVNKIIDTEPSYGIFEKKGAPYFK